MNWIQAFSPWIGGILRMRCDKCEADDWSPFTIFSLPRLLHKVHDFATAHAGHDVSAHLKAKE